MTIKKIVVGTDIAEILHFVAKKDVSLRVCQTPTENNAAKKDVLHVFAYKEPPRNMIPFLAENAGQENFHVFFCRPGKGFCSNEDWLEKVSMHSSDSITAAVMQTVNSILQ